MIINDLSVLFCQSFEDRSKIYAWCMHEGLDNVRGEQGARNKGQGTKSKEQGTKNKAAKNSAKS